jgi:hypothetical protein
MITPYITRIRIFIDNLSTKQFYQALGAVLGGIVVLLCLFGWLYFRSLGSLKMELEHINEQRLVVKKILDRAQRVSSQRKEVDELLAREKDFKIKFYFDDLLETLQLKGKEKGDIKVDSYGTEDGYSSDALQAQFDGLTMKELVTLLQPLEKNQRLYFKELSITKSVKQPHTIDVSLSIATLQPAAKHLEAGTTS